MSLLYFIVQSEFKIIRLLWVLAKTRITIHFAHTLSFFFCVTITSDIVWLVIKSCAITFPKQLHHNCQGENKTAKGYYH